MPPQLLLLTALWLGIAVVMQNSRAEGGAWKPDKEQTTLEGKKKKAHTRSISPSLQADGRTTGIQALIGDRVRSHTYSTSSQTSTGTNICFYWGFNQDTTWSFWKIQLPQAGSPWTTWGAQFVRSGKYWTTKQLGQTTHRICQHPCWHAPRDPPYCQWEWGFIFSTQKTETAQEET